MSKVISIIGKKRTGKTTFAVSEIKRMQSAFGFPVYAMDINNELADLGVKNEYRGKVDIDSFLSFVQNKKNCIILFEEAASYFSSRGREQIVVQMAQTVRHTNQIIFFVFHSIADLPTYVYNRTDWIALFKTNDYENSIDGKFRKNEQFMEFYKKVKADKNPHFRILYEPE